MRILTRDGHAKVLRAAFDEICNESDWKGPVDALVPVSDYKVYVTAVKSITGTHCKIHHCDKYKEPYYLDDLNAIRITSVGYQAGPFGINNKEGI
jgi:hypothetical protein